MGTAITAGEDFLRSRDTNRRRDLVGGALLAVGVTAGTAGAVGAVLWLLGLVHPGLAITTGIITAWTTLATRSLSDEASAVLDALDHQDLPKARRQLGRIVGRDTEALDESDVSRAVIETVAESTCDGIVSPLCYLAIGGPVAAIAFKAVSTLDSMLGHREPPYTYFGRASARLDDIANYIPARVTAFLLLGSAMLCGGNTRRAWRTWRRDGRLHDSPNAGHPEAAMAGALGVRLGGRRSYDGVPRDMP